MSNQYARASALPKAARPGRRKWAIGLSAAAADRIFWFLIVVTGIVGLSPLSGLAAARDTVAARRERRTRIATAPSELWARHARRTVVSPIRGWARSR